MTAGIKRDFTLKQWPVEYYQAVVDHFRGKVLFVQVGAAADDHPPLAGTVNLVGRTGIRDLMRLAYFADGGLGPITLLQHLCAAFEKPYVALLGGREPVSWTQYPLQTTLHTLGKLPCCRTRSCWRSRAVRLNDGWEQDDSLCESPVLDMLRPVGRCMAVIRPEDVIRAIETFYDGGALEYSVGVTDGDVTIDDSFTTDRKAGEAKPTQDRALLPPRPIPRAVRGVVNAGGLPLVTRRC